MEQKTLLNIGAGHPKGNDSIPLMFRSIPWKELRMDVDPANEPDVLASMLDMSPLASSSVDAAYSSHTIEHLYPAEIPVAVDEIFRVLKPDGFVVIVCPDLQAAAEMIAEDRLFDTAYDAPVGPVTPFDIVFSHRRYTGRDRPYMAHHSGFTMSSLVRTFKEGGFPAVAGMRDREGFQLLLVAAKADLGEAQMTRLAETAFCW